jgi:hypothetical protein
MQLPAIDLDLKGRRTVMNTAVGLNPFPEVIATKKRI